MNVYTRTTHGGYMQKIWSKDYEVGDYWTRTELNIFLVDPFQVVLEAVAGPGYAGDIAIDDTSFTPGCVPANVELVSVTTPVPAPTTPNPCAVNNQFMCVEDGQCIDQEKVCDFKVDCPMPGGSDEAECGTCTFDSNTNGTLCGWKDYSYSAVTWNLATGPTNFGPSADHSTGNGFYIAVQTNEFFSFASLRTPAIGPAGFECQMKFWYYLEVNQPSTYAKISAFLRRQQDNFTSFQFISHVDEPTGSQWKQGVVNIGHRGERFAIGRGIDRLRKLNIIFDFLFRNRWNTRQRSCCRS